MDEAPQPPRASAAASSSATPSATPSASPSASPPSQPTSTRSKRRSSGGNSEPPDGRHKRRSARRRGDTSSVEVAAAEGGVKSDNDGEASHAALSPRKRTFDRLASTSSTTSSLAPIHWPTYALTKTRFSVTDLVGPSWCEYAFMYGVLGQTHLPISQRPAQIVSEKGKVIKPDKKKTERQERTKKEGTRIHERLEREVHPEKVVVRATNREEGWARRFVGLIAGIRSLVDDGCVREMPVFGWVQGRLVTGIIDDVERRDIVVEREEPNDLASQGAAPSRPRITSKPRPSPGKAKPKQWSSQEEWKRDQARKKAVKDTSSAPAKDLRSFFGSPSPKKKASQQHAQGANDEAGMSAASVEATRKKEGELDEPAEIKEAGSSQAIQASASGWGFFLSDAKTRLSATLPLEAAQKAARLQVMLYKRLVDGLVGGALLSSCGEFAWQNGGQGTQKSGAMGIALDEHATPVYLPALYAQLDLDKDAELGEQFMSDVRPLLQSWGVALTPSQGSTSQPGKASEDREEEGERRCTLAHLGEVLTSALLDLVASARQGTEKLGLEGVEARGAHVIQPELTLVYRLQEQRGQFRRRGKASAAARRGKGQRKAIDVDAASISSSPMKAAPSTPSASQKGAATSPDLSRAPYAGSQATSTTTPGSVSVPSTPQSTAPRPTPTATSSRASRRSKAGSLVIGRVAFAHSSTTLEAHLRDVLDMWSLSRDLRGVGEEETWRCTFCAFREGCEWRDLKGRERVEEWWERRRAAGLVEDGEKAAEAEEESELWGLEMELEMDEAMEEVDGGEGTGVSLVPIAARVNTDVEEGGMEEATTGNGRAEEGHERTPQDEDDALWLHFADDDEELENTQALDW